MRLGLARRTSFVFICSITILAVFGSSAQAAFPGKNGRIAFVRSTPGERDVHIWTMEADGSSQKRLLARHGVAPAWSPHGTRIAFDNWIWEPGTITVAEADGSNVRTLTQGRDFRDPSWSPNGRQIVFNGLTDAYRIMIVNSDDGRITFRAPLLRHHKTVDRPRWSPRGDRIAFEVGPYRPGQDNSSEVFTMTPEGEDLRQLTDNRASEYDLDWSPDGSRLLYVRIREHSHRTPHRIESDIAVMGKNGHDVTILTHTKRNEGSAAFSPNGKRIVFDRCCYGHSKTSEIFVMRTDGTHVVRLTNNEVDDTAPDWQPIPIDL